MAFGMKATFMEEISFSGCDSWKVIQIFWGIFVFETGSILS